MRRRQRIIAGTLGVALLATACTTATGAEQAAILTTATAPVEVDADDQDPLDGELLAERDALLTAYGDLLVAAATTGGDALERTLMMTADDRERFDAICAPSWAHGLLTAAAAEAPLPVRTDGAELSVGTIKVPVSVEATRVVHHTTATVCDGRLPQPDRPPRILTVAATGTTAGTPTAAPAPTAATPSAPSTMPPTSTPPTSTPPTSTPPTTTPPTSSTPPPSPQPGPPTPAPAAPPTPTPAPTTPEGPWTAEDYDEELWTWAEGFLEIFQIVVEGQTLFGEIGGGELVAEGYAVLAADIGLSHTYWSTVEPPAKRGEAHDALLDGLELWEQELELLSVCAADPEDADCGELRPLREAWQTRFAEVTEQTGVPLPAGSLQGPEPA